MPDPRFFEDLGPIRLGELAALAGAELADPRAAERLVNGVAVLGQAGPDSITFLTDRRYADRLASSRAGACFLPAALAGLAPQGCVALSFFLKPNKFF